MNKSTKDQEQTATDMSGMSPDVLICECNSTEHQIIINYNKDDNIAYCHIHLTTHQNLFKRLWVGVRYAFGYKCRYGDWDEFILSDKHSPQLKELSELLAESSISRH